MSDNEERIVNKAVHADDLKYVKVYMDRMQDTYIASTDERLNEFKTQTEVDLNEFEDHVENRLDEIEAIAGGPIVFDVNTQMISASDSYYTLSSSSDTIFNSNNFGFYRSSSAVTIKSIDDIIAQMELHKPCTVCVNNIVYKNCELQYTSNYGVIYVYNAGLKIHIKGTGYTGSLAGTIEVYEYATSKPSYPESVTLTSLEFRGI